ALFVSFVLTGVWFSLHAQTTSKTVSTARATISGKVTIKGKPAVGVVVTIRKTEVRGPGYLMPRGTTDPEGAYRITNVDSGTYEVLPSAPAYVVSDLPNYARSKMVVVTEGENIEDINFNLIRGGVITGKITDADGRPAIQQQVSLFRAESFEPRRTEQPPEPPRISRVNVVTTDDRGIYRLFGIAAGQYKVAVGRGEETFSSGPMMGRASFKQVFYPDASDPIKATVIEVSEGSEATSIDISLARAIQTFSASGRVVDENDHPVPNQRLVMQRISGQMPEYLNESVTSNGSGDFVAEGLIPGKYVASLISEPGRESRTDGVAFDVIDQNMSGLTIKLMKGASISGGIVLELENGLASSKLSRAMIMTSVRSSSGPTTPGSMGQSAWSKIGPDGSFRLAGLPAGTAALYLGGSDSIAGSMNIVRIERDGIVLPRGIEIGERDQINGLRVVVSNGSATLRGQVVIQNGTVPPGGSIFVRLNRPGDPTLGPRHPLVDSRGHFIAEGAIGRAS